MEQALGTIKEGETRAMKFKVTMKDPDTLHDAINDAVAAEVGAIENLDSEEKADLAVTRAEKVQEICQKWFRYGEYVTIEIDTEAKTAVVVDKE